MKNPKQKLTLSQSAKYQIEVQGALDDHWIDWFEGMSITVESGNDTPTITKLTGIVTDQAALHGLLNKIRDLGLPLISVCWLKPE